MRRVPFNVRCGSAHSVQPLEAQELTISRPTWQLPPGVSKGTWDYVQSKKIAEDYEQFLRDHPLFQLDISFVRSQIPTDTPAGSSEFLVAADLGSGTGRVSRAFASERNLHWLNLDLSQSMLEEQSQLASGPDSESSFPIRANLVELDFLQPKSLDLAVCLFSSIGMIRGRKNRVEFLRGVRSALKPDASLILHVHNRLQSFWDPGGIYWLCQTFMMSLLGRAEYGDRVYAYRGLPTMFLHIYSRNELKAELVDAGFKNTELFAINHDGSKIVDGGVLKNVRAGGYFAVAK